MGDRVDIDVDIASQKMFRLRIESAAQHFLNKNLSATRRGIEPKKGAQQKKERQKSGDCVRRSP